MKIDREEIYRSVLDFLELLNNKNGNIPANIESLKFILDKIALIYHFIGNVSDDEIEYPKAQILNYSQWREVIRKRFPNLGFYNIPSTISENVGEAELDTGDAIDDLVDIANELSEFVWRWQNNSENDALWHFRFGYQNHWGNHLRSLQIYLHSINNKD